jgi:phage terminase large subunit GpA-like protein
MSDGFQTVINAWRTGLSPDAPLWIDEWAEEYAVIPADSGAAEPGKYRLDRTPAAREPLRALSPEHPAREVVMMVASQMMKTQIALIFALAVIHRAPANLILLEPSDKLAARVARRFDRSVSAVPEVRERVATQASRDEKNTQSTKEFRGGTAWFLSARSASNLAEASARYLIIDEVDRILRELKGEGDPLSLARKRLATFGRKAKILEISSPTEEEQSKIHADYLRGDQRQRYVPCPHCGEMQVLEWSGLHWDWSQNRAWMVCAVNGCIIEEYSKPGMFADVEAGGRAEWRPTAQGEPGVWSFQLSALYMPLGWTSWLDLAREYEAAKAALDQGDNEMMRVFHNTRLAQVYSAATSRVQPAALQAKAEPFALGLVPAPAVILTAAVDVQGNRLEVQVLGWGPGPCGLEAWTVATHILFGDTILPDVWRDLDELLLTPIQHAGGQPLIIRAVGIDTGDGDSTQEAYEFCRPRRFRLVEGQRQDILAFKGASAAKASIIGRGKKIEYTYRGRPAPGSVELFMVGHETTADWLMGRLALEDRIAVHTSADLQADFYEQLLSEVKVLEYVKGRKVKRYRPIKKGARNEQFDLARYNIALAHYLGLDRYTATRWKPLQDRLRAPEAESQSSEGDDMPQKLPSTPPSEGRPAPPPPPPPKRSNPIPHKPRPGYATNWRR